MKNPSTVSLGPTKTQFSPALEAEIQNKLDTFEESADAADPGEVFSRADAIKQLMQDSDDPTVYASQFKKELQDYGIKMGIYKPYTKDQLSRIHVTRGRKYGFRRGDTYYVFDKWTAEKPVL